MLSHVYVVMWKLSVLVTKTLIIVCADKLSSMVTHAITVARADVWTKARFSPLTLFLAFILLMRINSKYTMPADRKVLVGFVKGQFFFSIHYLSLIPLHDHRGRWRWSELS